MKKLTVERANELKAQGITHIASIVKSHYTSRYYKYESIDDIIENGGKMPEYSTYNGFVHGTIHSQIDWKHTIRWNEI